jgi:zinc and cadmium transporter
VDIASTGTLLALLAALIGVAGAAAGVSSIMGAPRKIVPFSGGLLIGVAVFGVLPDLAEHRGWAAGAGLLAAGIIALALFGRYVYPICPSCSHTHDHDVCARLLHGFAAPLIAAASLHAFLDGLGIAASQGEQAGGLGAVLTLGVILHKIPEGIALGIMLRASVNRAAAAFGWCALAEGTTLVGGLFESAITHLAGGGWLIYPLALAGGSFIYLGFHAIHGEWRRRGVPAFMPALTGAAGAAVLQQGLHALLR